MPQMYIHSISCIDVAMDDSGSDRDADDDESQHPVHDNGG